MIKCFIIKKLQDKKTVFLMAGGANTVFGYFVGLAIYNRLKGSLPLPVILVITNVVAITFGFTTFKLFVFKTKGRWISEYLRSYLVYGTSALVGFVAMYILVQEGGVAFWLAQIFTIMIQVVFSYFGHDKVTFKRAPSE